ncbi:hypothetical protein BC835DRAFT_1358749 [Cytidiella melzeri]|nr:hypothetical protein BC835DRAFT_1358749 [Cytidiella melzeri]
MRHLQAGGLVCSLPACCCCCRASQCMVKPPDDFPLQMTDTVTIVRGLGENAFCTICLVWCARSLLRGECKARLKHVQIGFAPYPMRGVR